MRCNPNQMTQGRYVWPREDRRLVERILTHVSEYATFGPLEFVAEVYTAQRVGRPLTLPLDLQALYNRYGGP